MGTTNEQLFRGILRAPLTTLSAAGDSQFAGQVTVASGSTTATVSTALVNSDSLILLTFHSTVASNVAQIVRVNTIASGSYFSVACNPAPVGAATIGFMLFKVT